MINVYAVNSDLHKVVNRKYSDPVIANRVKVFLETYHPNLFVGIYTDKQMSDALKLAGAVNVWNPLDNYFWRNCWLYSAVFSNYCGSIRLCFLCVVEADKMKIFEIVFWNGESQIVFAETRREIRKKFIGIREINRVEIHWWRSFLFMIFSGVKQTATLLLSKKLANLPH